MAATKAGVTGAPPLDTRRSVPTRSVRNPPAPTRLTKKVGGPAMKEIRSASIRSTACSGSQRAMRTEVIPVAAGRSTPFNNPEMWAMGAGTSTASAGTSPWARVMAFAFQARPRWVCNTALGLPVDPEVNTTRARSAGRAAETPGGTRAPAGSAAETSSATPSRIAAPDLGGRRSRPAHHQTGGGLLEGRGQLRRAGGRVDRRGHRAQPPAGPEEQHGGQPVGQLPGHGVAPPHAGPPQPAGQVVDRPGQLGPARTPPAVDHPMAPPGSRRRQQRVE